MGDVGTRAARDIANGAVDNDCDDSDTSEEEPDPFEESDRLLADMKKLALQASAAVENIDKVDERNDTASTEMHDRLNKTALGIIAAVVSGEPEEQAPEEPPQAELSDGALNESEWVPPAAETPPSSSGGGSSSGRFACVAPPAKNAAAGAVVSDISRLASRPLIAGDSNTYASRKGAPQRPKPLTSGSELGAFAAGRGRGRGSRMPAPRE